MSYNTVCYWSKKVIAGKKSISYEGAPSTFIVIRSRATFNEFMDKLYRLKG